MVVAGVGSADAVLIIKSKVNMTERVVVVVRASIDSFVPKRLMIDFMLIVVVVVLVRGGGICVGTVVVVELDGVPGGFGLLGLGVGYVSLPDCDHAVLVGQRELDLRLTPLDFGSGWHVVGGGRFGERVGVLVGFEVMFGDCAVVDEFVKFGFELVSKGLFEARVVI